MPDFKFTPQYIYAYKSGELDNKIKLSEKILKKCALCPQFCGINRNLEYGKCNSGIEPVVSSYNSHFGEEPPITGIYGSGTIFFSNCTMNCIYCQNYPISQLGKGKRVGFEDLADMMLYLQTKKCHNINFVTPTHFVSHILKSLRIAVKKGLHIPLVYNTSGYESPITLQLLDGIIDIYLPDIKYTDDSIAYELSGVKNYTYFNRLAIKEMFRQVGLLEEDSDGIARKGIIIRHLVLPGNIRNSMRVFDFLAENISKDVTVSLMAQYFPAYKAVEHITLNRKITKEEYETVLNYALDLGFENILIQELDE